jgi:hypothetical protein
MDLCCVWEEATDWAARIVVQGQHINWLEVCTYKAHCRMLHVVLAHRQ